jgi:hypothetical protein
LSQNKNQSNNNNNNKIGVLLFLLNEFLKTTALIKKWINKLFRAECMQQIVKPRIQDMRRHLIVCLKIKLLIFSFSEHWKS